MDCYHNGVECYRNDGSSHCSETMGAGPTPCSADDMCAGCMYDGNGMTVMGDMDCYHNGVECYRNDGSSHCSETMGAGSPCVAAAECASSMCTGGYCGTGVTGSCERTSWMTCGGDDECIPVPDDPCSGVCQCVYDGVNECECLPSSGSGPGYGSGSGPGYGSGSTGPVVCPGMMP